MSSTILEKLGREVLRKLRLVRASLARLLQCDMSTCRYRRSNCLGIAGYRSRGEGGP